MKWINLGEETPTNLSDHVVRLVGSKDPCIILSNWQYLPDGVIKISEGNSFPSLRKRSDFEWLDENAPEDSLGPMVVRLSLKSQVMGIVREEINVALSRLQNVMNPGTLVALESMGVRIAKRVNDLPLDE